MVCRPSGSKIQAFKTRAVDNLLLCHDGKGVYRVVMENTFLLTNHVKK